MKMNQQNYQNMQGVRQISPTEVAQAQGLSQAELQKTQVLNLKEVEDVARIEKLSSKKPAIVVAIIGILCIAFGATFNVAQRYQANRKNNVEKRAVIEEKEEKQKEPVKETTLKCIKNNQAKPDGTDTAFIITYNFENDKLVRFTKYYRVTVTPGSTTGPVTIQSYINSYQAFLNPTEGYQISVEPLNNGVEVNVQVDYEKLDLTKLNPKQQEHVTTSVEYPIDSSYEKIKTESTAVQLTCE